ncbi:disulfide bond formation protein B [Albidovulum sp.]|jgi:disulfide bond formation protein DsbB|uniref:disulfide bond formation protein B n=1 Tax=Albidovulum sp. TaxID=1872424 RepID=UPI00303E84A8
MSPARQLILFAALGSAALLAGAHVFQAMGYAPCKLCLWQRGPHWAAVAIGLLALCLPWRVLPWAGALAAAATGALGVYHTGVEQKWWLGPTSCTSGGTLTGSAEDLLGQIMAAPLIRCDEVAWSLMGLSMASWNALLSFALAAIWIAAARRR